MVCCGVNPETSGDLDQGSTIIPFNCHYNRLKQLVNYTLLIIRLVTYTGYSVFHNNRGKMSIPLPVGLSNSLNGFIINCVS